MQEKFRTGLLHSAEEFKKTVSSVVDEFETHGPFSHTIPCKQVSSNIICIIINLISP